VIVSKVEDITYDWSRDAGTGDEYGLLAEILGVDEYDHQSGISRTLMMAQLMPQPPPTRKNAKRKNGNAYARAGIFAKDSSRVSCKPS
jgi:hypothetical protein